MVEKDYNFTKNVIEIYNKKLDPKNHMLQVKDMRPFSEE